MKLCDVSPAIIDQISQEPEDAYWFVWDRGTDRPWANRKTGYVLAFAFESDAAHLAAKSNGRPDADVGVCDGYPRQATVKEAKAARPENDIALFDRDLNFIRRLA